MSRTGSRSSRRWWILGIVVAGLGLAAIPVAGVAHYMTANAIGRTTVAANADGTERTIYWREYPGIAGVDGMETLGGPTPQDGYAAGQAMIAEMREALSAEFNLEWAPIDDQEGPRLFHPRVQNGFGGQSLLTVVNGPESQSTSVPQAWADKQRAITIIGEIAFRYGFGTPAIHVPKRWTDEDRIRDLGGLTPEEQVVVTSWATGPAGQWLSVRFQDLSKDTTGGFATRFEQLDGSRWQLNTIGISYGADGLLPADLRGEFESRLEPFAGLSHPAALES